MASQVAKQVTWHYVYVGLGFLPSQGSTSDMRGNGDSDCVLGRMGLQQEVLLVLARQLHEYPARPSSYIEGYFEWVNKTGNVHINIVARSCKLFCCGKAVLHTGVGPGVAQWLRRCATSRTVPGSIPGGVTGFFGRQNL
jgi:hypothetical protein